MAVLACPEDEKRRKKSVPCFMMNQASDVKVGGFFHSLWSLSAGFVHRARFDPGHGVE
nr:MAG TPA: YbgE [Caudoviricetes sp.]